MGKCDAGSGVLFSACLRVSQSCLSGQMLDSPACLPVSPSLCGQMPDAVTPLRGCVARLLPVSAVSGLSPACLPVSDARCCDAGSGVVSPACLPVSQSPRSDARCCDAGSGLVSRLSPCVSQSLRSDARCCDAGSRVVSPASLVL